MFRISAIIITILVLHIGSMVFASSLSDSITIGGKQFSYDKIYRLIEQVLPEDADRKYAAYIRLNTAIDTKVAQEKDPNRLDHFMKLQHIITAGRKAQEHYSENQVQEIVL